jgi:hypothetical protein
MEVTVTNTQLFLSIGIPTLAIVLGYLATLVQIATINARIGDVTSRLARLEDKFDTLMEKFYELDNRVSRVEELLRH